jgi:hypothetical protein
MQAYTFIEFFAGQANVTKCIRKSGQRAARLDVTYHQAKEGKHNFMDILSPAGMAQLLCN